MVVARSIILAALGLAVGACANNNNHNSLPTPRYDQVKTPPAYRKAPDDQIIDNANVKLDAQGYRVDDKGNRIAEVDVQQKMAGEKSNPMAGYYISSTGAVAAGNVMAPSVGATAGIGTGPGSNVIVPGGEGLPGIPQELVPTPGERPPSAPR